MTKIFATNAHRIRFDFYNSRRNFPANISRKRGESNFLRAFERTYITQSKKFGISASEFALQNYGRADLIWIAWNPAPLDEDFSAIALHRHLRRHKLIAFEAKLKDWRKGLQQAFRYRYFADKAIQVMPEETVAAAISNLESFERLEVGLWSFDKETERIREIYSPNQARALNKDAREKAISLISGKINLSKIREHFDAVTNRV